MHLRAGVGHRLGLGWGASVDPWFQEPLWLTAPFRGKVVWAFNVGHLQVLRDYVAAGLREDVVPHPYKTMLEKLPSWLTAASNRADLAKVFEDLALLAQTDDRGRRPVLDGKPTRSWHGTQSSAVHFEQRHRRKP